MTIHVAASADIGRAVRRGLRESVRFVPDNWLVGPCAAAPEAHAPMRCGYWGFEGRERSRFSRSFRDLMEALDSPERTVLWTSPLGSDTVAVWALCAWRLLRRPDQPNLELALLDGAVRAGDATGVSGGFLGATPADVRRSLEHARPVSLTRAREMALFWRRLSGPAPLLSGKGVATARRREQILDLASYQARFFPRLGGSTLTLSLMDELLFSCLDTKKWSTAADVVMCRGAAGEELRSRWLSVTGDIFVSSRLAQWARHDGHDAALISEPYRPDNAMMAARYKLSETGHEMRHKGLTEVAQGAPLAVWGVTAYDPLCPWVVVEGDTGQRRLQKLGERSVQ